MVMESEHSNTGDDKHLQTPAEVKLDDDDDIFGLGKSSRSAVESGHSGASNIESQPPAEVVTVIEDDLLGLGKSSRSAVESGHSGECNNESIPPAVVVTVIEDDLLGLGKSSRSAVESGHSGECNNESIPPAVVVTVIEDDLLCLGKSSRSAVESGHSGECNNESIPPAVVVTVIEDDLLGLGKSSILAVESGHSGECNNESQPPAEVVPVVEDDLLGLGKTSSTVMDTGDDAASNKHTQTSADVTRIDDDLLESGEMSDPSSPSSSSSSSSSDSSFDENFFLIDEIEPDQDPQPKVETNNLLQLDEDPHLPVSYNAQGSHSKPASCGPIHTPDVSAPGSESSSPKQSPKIQLMERLEPPDPSRIPATVFARTKSTAPVEWSTASNESLFSIHMGNNSFSRDQIFLMGRSQELGLTQELGKSDDMFKFPNNTSSEVNNFSGPARSVTIYDQKSSGICVAEVAAETMKEVIRETAQDFNKAKPSAEVMHRSISISHRSQDSNASTMSFAFPILTKDGTKGSSVKVEPEKQKPEQQKQQQQSKPQPPGGNATGTNWYSCFTCSFCR